MFDAKDSEEIRLICAFRGGDMDAYSALLLKYEPLFASLIAMYVGGENGFDEIRYVLEDAFRDCAIKYDVNDKERTFGAYAKTAMMHRVSRYRKQQRKHSFDLLSDNTSDGIDLEEELMKQEFFRRIVEKMKEICSPFEYRVFLSYLNGDTPKKTAKILHSDAKTVSNAKGRALSKMRKNASEFLL